MMPAPPAPSSPAPCWQYRPVEPEHRSQAMALMGRPVLESVIDNAPNPACPHHDRPDGKVSEQLWAAWDHDGRMHAAVWLIPRPGHSAMIFTSRPARPAYVKPTAGLIDCACRAIERQGVYLIQTLLDRRHDLLHGTLEQAGFEDLAWLEYLQRPIGSHHPHPDLPASVQLSSYHPKHRAEFLAALQASYEQTLDCPAICGRRRLEDILAGHRAAGRFLPDLWTLLRIDGQVAGVMLLASLPQHQAVELVYLGLARPFRRQGWGRWLIQRALHQCVQVKASVLCTAVDRANHPACRLYREMGFEPVTRKLAMIRTQVPPE